MAFAVAGQLAGEDVGIDDVANVATSFPGFDELARQAGFGLRARCVRGVALLLVEPVVDRDLHARRDGPAVLDRRAELPLAHFAHRRAIEDARAAAPDDLDVAGVAEYVALRLHPPRAYLAGAPAVGRNGRTGPGANR